MSKMGEGLTEDEQRRGAWLCSQLEPQDDFTKVLKIIGNAGTRTIERAETTRDFWQEMFNESLANYNGCPHFRQGKSSCNTIENCPDNYEKCPSYQSQEKQKTGVQR